MKSFICLIIFLTSFSQIHSQSYDPFIEELINQTNLDSLVSFVRILSGEDSVMIGDTTVLIQHRVSNQNNDLAADYIKQKLEGYDLDTYDQVYSSGGRNIYAIQTGILYPDEQYIICAHYDAVTDYCADDDASGTAGVLEAARILSNYQLDYTLIYALWDEEEIGLIGSGYYASQAFSNNDNILGVVNLEMSGWDSDDDGLIDIHTRNIANSVSLANLVFNIVSVYNLSLAPVIYNPGATNSDHDSFWDEGYSAIVFSEAFWGGDFNPYYHTIDDRIDRFNLPYFHKLVKLAVGSISTLVDVKPFIPVELTSFAASVNESDVTLRWSTATEVNNIGFEVQRSNGGEFIAVGFVDGYGTTAETQNYTFTDKNLEVRPYSYRLKQVDFDGTSKYSEIVEVDVIAPDVFALEQNYPNPFNPGTKIKFSLAANSKVSLKVFDILGQEVAILISGDITAGSHEMDFNASNINSGIYFYRIDAIGVDGNNFTSVKKMVLTK
jgi:hypothetical protein